MSGEGFFLKLFLIIFVVIGAGATGFFLGTMPIITKIIWWICCGVAGYAAGRANFD